MVSQLKLLVCILLLATQSKKKSTSSPKPFYNVFLRISVLGQQKKKSDLDFLLLGSVSSLPDYLIIYMIFPKNVIVNSVNSP